MANPLTLYVPIKQDALSQAAATAAAAVFVKNVQAGLDKANIVHYARLALIPNLSGKGILAICLITTFDKAMIPYLDFFWKDPGTHKAFAGVAALALNPPNPPVGNNHNKPADLYEAYPDTVAKIKGAPAKPKPPVKGGAKTGSKGGAKKGAKKR